MPAMPASIQPEKDKQGKIHIKKFFIRNWLLPPLVLAKQLLNAQGRTSGSVGWKSQAARAATPRQSSFFIQGSISSALQVFQLNQAHSDYLKQSPLHSIQLITFSSIELWILITYTKYCYIST
jgi:hypothetical protein